MKFDTIASLKSTAGTTDNFANVLGYYAIGDGGGGEFYWDLTSTLTDNGGTIFKVTGITTGRWKRLYNGSVFIKWFGAKADGLTDDSVYIQNLINAFSGGNFTSNLNLVVESDPNAKYAIANTIYIPWNVNFDFNHALIIPMTGGVFQNNFMFYLNADSTGKIIANYSNGRLAFIRNILINNTNNVATMRIFYSLSKHSIENIRADKIQTLYSRTASYTLQEFTYNDQITLRGLYTTRLGSDTDTTVKMINIGWLGDNLLIENVELHGAKLNIEYCQGGVLDRILNADITVYNCYGLTISNSHIETGKIIIKNSIIKLSNILHYFHYDANGGVPLTITNDSSSYDCMANKNCVIENYSIMYYNGKTQLPDTGGAFFDALINGNVIINNFFRATSSGNSQFMTNTATRITLDGTNSLDDYNLCAANSISSVIVNGRITSSNQSINAGVPTVYYGATTSGVFSLAAGDYYYKVVVLLGDSRCKLATSTGASQLLISIANPAVNAPIINNPLDRNGNSFTIRLYRGTQSGQYGYFVDIPFTSFNTVVDYGYFTNTGHYWETRTEGPIDSFNTASSSSFFIQNADGTKIVKLAAAPVYGTWKVGDKIEKLAPDTTNTGWICTAISPLTFLPV